MGQVVVYHGIGASDLELKTCLCFTSNLGSYKFYVLGPAYEGEFVRGSIRIKVKWLNLPFPISLIFWNKLNFTISYRNEEILLKIKVTTIDEKISWNNLIMFKE